MEKTAIKDVIKAQVNELTEHHIYKNLSEITKSSHNKNILRKLSNDELRHHDYWRSVSKTDIRPKKLMIWFYTAVAYLFGLSFGLKLMEKGERLAQKAYKKLSTTYSKGRAIMLDEQKHEKALLSLLEEEKLEYASSIVLGLNDALVELTGALAGLTFALQDGSLIALIGLITGIAASLSMAASGYLSSKEEKSQNKKPLKSAVYTGTAYIITVILLVLPFFLLKNVFLSLALMLVIALLIIFTYTFYIAVAKELRFRRRFMEMAAISLGVALISFLMGVAIKLFFGVSV